jgi:hypothetical protein
MATPQEMVRLLQEALQSNIGVKQITADGQTISFNSRTEMLAELSYWETKAQRATKKRPLFRGIDNSSAWY